MTLSPGHKLGPYQIVEPIGAGGMGEVYRAHDPRMSRDVAIKVSAEQFSERFDREIRAVASLNHVNICTLHDVGPNYLVMELVEGLTLADRIQQGPIPLEEALMIARQIADALDAAHAKEIVHRDLKPANIKIRPDGSVKVLDFGLAKIGSTPAAATDESPTFTIGATQTGVILGTAPYMSPEQARGKAVDKRADIWAFGVVLYEMLTGERLFTGEDVSETLAAVIKEQPNWERAPARVHRLLQACLEKNPKQRLRDIGDVWRLLNSATDEAPRAGSAQPRRRPWLAWSVAGVASMIAITLVVLRFQQEPPRAPDAVRFSIALPETGSFGRSLTVSPDGRRFVFRAVSSAVSRLWVRDLDSFELRSLPGTEGVFGYAFWSPDGRYVVFAVSGTLKKIDPSGGPPTTIGKITGSLAGGFWTADNNIVFGTEAQNPLFRIPAEGGDPQPITTFDSQRDLYHSFPVLLPDGKHFIYTRSSTSPEASGIYLDSVDRTPEQQVLRRLLPDVSMPVFAPALDGRSADHILFVRENTLMARPFDTSRLDFSGEAVPLVEQVYDPGTYSISTTGILVYRKGGVIRQLTWYDRNGTITGTAWEPGPYTQANLSPDGSRVAVERGLAGLWIFDLARRASTPLGADRIFSTWSPDGKQLAFLRNQKFYVADASGVGNEKELLDAPPGGRPLDWLPDGHILFQAGGTSQTKTDTDLWTWQNPGKSPSGEKPKVYLGSQFNERWARFSPDGRFVAYVSDESGRAGDIYVRPFSDANSGKWPISTAGGNQPRWRQDGKELLFMSPDRKLMSVDVTLQPTFKAGFPKVLFQTAVWATLTPSSWDMTPDGERFLVITSPLNDPASIAVEMNWQKALRK